MIPVPQFADRWGVRVIGILGSTMGIGVGISLDSMSLARCFSDSLRIASLARWAAYTQVGMVGHRCCDRKWGWYRPVTTRSGRGDAYGC